jgi:hypothetical protein
VPNQTPNLAEIENRSTLAAKADLERLFSECELADLESEQFRRLLRRAHAEGRLVACFS